MSLPQDEIVELYCSGKCSVEIAEHYKVSPSAVLWILRKHGVARRSGKDAAQLRNQQGRMPKIRYWKGKKQPREMVENRLAQIRGEKHWLWKGGADRRGYRKKVKKEKCELCASRLNLGIHHKNFDHYDDAPENLQVLCLPCHMSIHKQAYWDAVKRGEKPPQSNGPVGWERQHGNLPVLWKA